MSAILRQMFLLFLLMLSVAGQDKPLALDEVQGLYENLQYHQVISRVKTELEARPQQPLSRLEVLLKYLALAEASLGREAEARGTLASLVLVNPDFQFQPGEVSPKIMEIFQDVRSEYVRSGGTDKHQPTYLVRTDRRSQLILKSIAFPGWGQVNAGEKRGYAWGTLFTAALVGSGIATYMTQQTHTNYLDAYDPDEISTRYDTYNQWYQTRNTLILTTVLTYTGNLL
ncbi:MAG: hypothetical protein K9M19_08455, partial [Candidatus Marinimicrobia bacterium]|nr:hypothetical protein [Candidatus Neomarinimicrobiota bacterium]